MTASRRVLAARCRRCAWWTACVLASGDEAAPGSFWGGGRKLTEGTLGLEGAQFLDSPMEVGIVAAGVTVKLTELGFILFEQQRVDAVLLHQAGFEDTAAPDIPVGVEDCVVHRAFEFAFGREFCGERLAH